MLMDEIQARKAEIKTEMESEGITEERLAELETEVDTLNAEERSIIEAAEERKALEETVKTASCEEIKIENTEETTMSVDYRSAFLKKLQGKELTEEERGAVTATAAIPTETMNKIVGILEGSPIYNAIDVTFIPGNVSYPVESSIGDAAWVTMGNAATDSADALTSISLSAYKLIKTVEITANVAAMAVDAFEDWLVSRLADKIMKAIDVAVINGNGSNKATGIEHTLSTTYVTYSSAGLDYAGLCACIAALPAYYHGNATMVMNRQTFFGNVLGMEDTTKNRVVVADAQSPAKFNVLGYPVIVDDNCATDEILFGDFKAYKFNFAQAPEVTSDDSVAFRTGSRVYRAMALADGKLADKNAIVRYLKSTT